MRPRTFSRMLATSLVLSGTSLVFLTWLATVTFRELSLEALEDRLEADARLVATSQTFGSTGAGLSGPLVAAAGRDGVHFRLIEDRAEVRQALAGERVGTVRFSPELGEPALYVAIPVERDGDLVSVVQAYGAVSPIDAAVARFRSRLGLGALGIFGLLATPSLVFSRRFARPIEQIGARAEALARGDTEARLPLPDSAELAGLADALNRLSLTLDERSREASRLRQELDTLLSSVLEAILIVDADGRVVDYNLPAARMLGLDPQKAPPGALGHPGLTAFVKRTLASSEPIEEELRLGPDDNRHLELRGTPLRDRFFHTTGAVVALDDRTELRNLANVRRDFAAQVSHELKTPLTAIKGFADTLLAGALSEPRNAEPFVRVIAEQTARLHDLVEGLMELARLERKAETGAIEKSWHPVSELLERAVSELDGTGPFRVHLDCPPGLTARVNPVLLERAVRNLVDNAMRYAHEGGGAWVSAQEEGEEIVICVRDEGAGIGESDRKRVFERFYRVSGTRSRHPEGSGLGLAIVKHVVRAHGGRVSVESPPEGGASFTLRIPRY